MITKQHLEEISFACKINAFGDDFRNKVYNFLKDKCDDTDAKVLSVMMCDTFFKNGLVSLYDSYCYDDILTECILYLINSVNNKKENK